MATKLEIYSSAMELCEAQGASETLVAGLTALLEPKKAGAQFVLEDIAVIVDGVASHILDSVLKVWVPVFDEEGNENFYAKPDTELGWSRFSKAAEKQRKDNEKTFKATKDAVLSDLMAGNIDAEEAQATMADAEIARKEHTAPEGSSTERPE